MLTIRVITKSTGKPAKGQRVVIGFPMGMSGTEYTDSDGDAHFTSDPKNGTVYVNGQSEYKGHISGRVVIYI